MINQPKKKTRKPMRRRRMWCISGIGVLLLLGLSIGLLYPAILRSQTSSIEIPSKTATKEILYTSDVADVESITVMQRDGETYTLVNREDSLYLLIDDEERIINQTYSATILSTVTLISVEDTVSKTLAEVEEYLPDMGLVDPALIVETTFSDGRIETMTIGDTVPLTTYYYYQWSGKDGIYMCNLSIAELFWMPQNQLLPMDQPTFASTLIDRVTMDYGDDNIIDMTFTTDDLGLISGMMQSPVVYPMDATASENLLLQIEQFSLGSYEGLATEESMEAYGLNDPFVTLTVHQQAGAYNAVDEEGQLIAQVIEEQEITLVVGSVINEHYYSCQYLDSIYLISGVWFSILLDKEPDDYVTLTPLNLGNAAISSMVFQIGEGALDIRVSYTEEVLENNELALDEDGNILYNVTATCNGEEMTEDEMYSLFVRLQSFQVRGNMEDLDATFTTTNRVPRWQLTLVTVGGTTRTVSAYTVDYYTDALVVDGVLMHYADVQQIEIALAEWMPTSDSGETTEE